MGVQGEGREEPGGGGELGSGACRPGFTPAVAPGENFQGLLSFSFTPGESASCHLAGGWED